MARILAATVLVAGAAVSAQQLSLSANCQTAVKNIAANKDASACLQPAPLIAAVASTDANSSIVEPVNSWLTSLCSASPCSNSTLEFIVNTATDGCATELSLIGYDSSQKSQITDLVKQIYPTARKVVCLKEGNDNCITKTLKGVEASVGTLSANNLAKLVGSANLGIGKDIPKDVQCSNCIKAAYNAINTDFPGVLSSSKDELSQQCGASFVDGQAPSGITQSAASTSSSGGNNGAIASLPDLATYLLVAVGGVFAAVA
jgi:hypothetical protein